VAAAGIPAPLLTADAASRTTSRRALECASCIHFSSVRLRLRFLMGIGVRDGRTVHTCSRCSQEIPPRRRYCRAHYEQALAEYDARLAEYERAVVEWHGLSEEQRSDANREAEASSILALAALLGGILGGCAWAYLYFTRKLDALYGLMIVAGGALGFVLVPPVRYLAGKLMRTTLFALLNVAVLGAIVWLLRNMSNVVASHSREFFIGAACIGVLFASARELLGHHHASAAPVRPTPPAA